jgi:hypothetical protein
MNNAELTKYHQALALQREPDIHLNPYKFKGLRTHNSECDVKIWFENDKAIILFTDIGKGTSVTNASEQLVTEIYNSYLTKYDKKNLMFMETYERNKRHKIEDVDVVVPIWQDNEAVDVNWFHLGKLM